MLSTIVVRFLFYLPAYCMLGYWALFLSLFVSYAIPPAAVLLVVINRFVGIPYVVLVPLCVCLYMYNEYRLNSLLLRFWCRVTPEWAVRVAFTPPGGSNDHLLAMCYAIGLGVKCDMETACTLMLQARARGCDVAGRLYYIPVEECGIEDFNDFSDHDYDYYGQQMAILIWHMRGKPSPRPCSQTE